MWWGSRAAGYIPARNEAFGVENEGKERLSESKGKCLLFSPEMTCRCLAVFPPCFYLFIGKSVGRILMAALSLLSPVVALLGSLWADELPQSHTRLRFQVFPCIPTV